MTGHQEFFDGLDWFDPQHCARLDDELRWAREECPVVHTKFGGGMHVVTRYDDVRNVAAHPELFSSAKPGIMEVPMALHPVDLDPPRHTDFRAFLNGPFSRPALERYRPVLEQLADDLIDGFADSGQVEFVSGYAIPFISSALAKVVLEDDNEDRMRRAVEAVTAISVEGTPESFAAVAGLAAELIAEREAAADDREDFLRALINATVEGGRPLTVEERLSVVTLLMIGGLETTRGVLTHIGRFLAEQPGMETLLREPDWAKHDLDEILRFTSTVTVMSRVVVQDNDMLGVPLEKGDRVAIHWRSANRDSARFDDPDRLDFSRNPNPQMAFGVGVHRCVGRHFARLQLEIAIDRLLARLTNFRIAPGTTVRTAAGTSYPAPEEIHLQYDVLNGADVRS